MSGAIPVALGVAIVASSSFVLGQYLNHTHIWNNLSKLIKTNPYAFYLKDKLQKIFTEISTEDDEKPSNMSEIMKYGFPGLDDVRVFSDFVVSYDRRNRVAHWAFEHLTEQTLSDRHKVNRRFAAFRSDMGIPSLFRSHNYDYFRSGFDRGHLAAAANHRLCQTDCNETFYLTNVAPQVGKGFNRDAWNNLEIYCRHLTSLYPDVYVCTGSVYKPEVKRNDQLFVEYRFIGQGPVAVPTHFFKVIVCESADHRFSVEAYMLPNKFISNNVDLKNFRQPLEEIERASGLHFFDKIDRNEFVSVNGQSMVESHGGSQEDNAEDDFFSILTPPPS